MSLVKHTETINKWRNISTIEMTLNEYEEKFGIRPVRMGKENKFELEKGVFLSIGEIFEARWGKTEKSRRVKVDMSQYDKSVSTKSTKPKAKSSKKSTKVSASGKVNLKQFCRDKIKEGLKPSQVRQAIVDRYVTEGKKKSWAEGRAKAIHSDVSKNG